MPHDTIVRQLGSLKITYVKDIQSLNWDEPLNLDEVFELIYKSFTFDSKKLDSELVEKYNQGGIRQLFIDEYTYLVVNELRFNRKRLNKSLEILYYAPKILIKHLRIDVLWDIVARSLEVNLTNIGLNKEDVVLKLLESVYEKIGDTQLFLDELFTKKTSYQSNYFTALYKSLHTGSFTKYILLLIQQWKQSSYANMEKREYVKLGDSVLNPVICGYTSGKSWSFYHENTNFEWTVDGYITIEVTTENEGVKNYEYHPYDLIAISNAENENISFTGQQLDHISFMPAFALFAHSDVTFWKNSITVAEYTGDVISLAVGLGPAWRSFRIVSALAKAATTTQKVFVIARSAIGVMEVTAGTANIILKATEYRDTEFGRKLANVFIWMEFASLGTDVALGVAKRLSASAKLALGEADQLLRAANRSKADKLLDTVKRKNGEIVAIARLSLTEFKQMGHLLLGNLEGARYIVAERFRSLVGAIAGELKAAGVQLLELSGEALKELKNLGIEFLDGLFLNTLNLKNIPDNGFAYAIIYNGKGYLASSVDEAKGFFNAMSDNLNKGASQVRRGGRAGKNLDKIEEAFEAATETTLLQQKVKRIKEMIETFVDVNGSGKYSPHEIESFADIELLYKTVLRASKSSEAGDVFVLKGILKGQSLDPLGLAGRAVDSWKKRFNLLWNEKRQFANSIDRHFKKIHSPEPGKLPLDKVVLDFRHMDDVGNDMKQKVIDYIYNGLEVGGKKFPQEYKQYVNDNHFIKLNF